MKFLENLLHCQYWKANKTVRLQHRDVIAKEHIEIVFSKSQLLLIFLHTIYG